MNILDFSINDLHAFILMFFRVAGLMMFAPLFGSQSIPPTVKIMFSLIMVFILYPIIKPTVNIPENAGYYIFAVVSEFAVGFIIGFSASLLFSALQFGGQIIDQEIGLGLANIIDPISNQQVSIIGQFKLLLGMIIYLSINGHFFVIDSMVNSFKTIPLLGLSLSNDVGLKVTDVMVGNMFVIAVKVAAPALVTLLLITIAMAFMARTVPEMNIFILGFSLRIIVGFLVLAFGIPAFAYVFDKLNLQSVNSVNDLMVLMKG